MIWLYRKCHIKDEMEGVVRMFLSLLKSQGEGENGRGGYCY